MPQSVDRKKKTASISAAITAQNCRRWLRMWDLAHWSGEYHDKTIMLAVYATKKITAAPAEKHKGDTGINGTLSVVNL